MMLQATPDAKLGGMAGGLADPAALLRLYLAHGRLQSAAQLAIQHLTAWHKQVSTHARLPCCLSSHQCCMHCFMLPFLMGYPY